MYHRTPFQTLLLTVLLSALQASSACLAASESVKAPLAGALSISGEPNWSLPPTVKQFKKRPTGIEIYQFDREPVGNRAPLIMVHGLLGEYWECFRWRKMIRYLKKDPRFAQRYKVVLLRYDSHRPLKQIVPGFTHAAEEVSTAFGRQPLTVVALSMGGNILQEAMTDPIFDKKIKQVITMGTPFHGSPLFSSNWMEYSMLKNYHSPLSRIDTAIPYRLYFNRHKNLLSDLHWDNADRFIPDVGNFHYFFPVSSKGTVSPTASENDVVLQLNSPGLVDKSKFTVYGGYLLTDYAKENGPNSLATILKFPYKFTFTVLPEHLGREHPVLRALNQHIARAIVNDPAASDTSRVKYAYALNDGITPVVSSLFLPNASLVGFAISERNVESIAKVIDVKRARLFRNIDHLTFIDDYHPHGGSSQLKDELAPGEGMHQIFEWIKGDLLI